MTANAGSPGRVPSSQAGGFFVDRPARTQGDDLNVAARRPMNDPQLPDPERPETEEAVLERFAAHAGVNQVVERRPHFPLDPWVQRPNPGDHLLGHQQPAADSASQKALRRQPLKRSATV